MNVVVESIDNQIFSDYCFKGWLGAKNADHNVSLLSLGYASMIQNKLKEDKPMPIGSVEYMTWFMKYIYNIPIPEPLKAHKLAPNFYSLKWKEVDIKANIEYPCFIKPLNDVKKFTGFVAKSEKDFELYSELENWDGPYFTTEIIDDIISEWRYFIHRGKVVNVSNYFGNSCIYPNYMADTIVEGLIHHDDNYRGKKLPISYTIDIGITKYKDVHLIELNDMWAIGPYGCNENDYFAMLKDRWNQIIRNI